MAEQHWDPSRLFEGATGRGYAVILLNQPILPVHRSSFLKLWCGGEHMLQLLENSAG